MTTDTWNRLEKKFVEYPENRAVRGADYPDIASVARQIGVPFSSDYAEFIHRYGGAAVGIYEIVGIYRADSMSTDVETALELTNHFRKQLWPGTECWAVFSTDQAGNPIGLDKDGVIWLSDAENRQIVAICQTFEEFLRSCCLCVETEAADYYAELPWPETERTSSPGTT